MLATPRAERAAAELVLFVLRRRTANTAAAGKLAAARPASQPGRAAFVRRALRGSAADAAVTRWRPGDQPPMLKLGAR